MTNRNNLFSRPLPASCQKSLKARGGIFGWHSLDHDQWMAKVCSSSVVIHGSLLTPGHESKSNHFNLISCEDVTATASSKLCQGLICC